MTEAALLPTIQQALVESAASLATNLSEPEREAQYLLAAVLNQSRSWVIAYAEKSLTAEQTQTWRQWLAQRVQDVPLAYLTGSREFWSLPLVVTPATLIPRPETEHCVELALQHLDRQQPARILDLGAGSGAIGLALASESPNWQVVATDISAAALKVAQRNAHLLGLQSRVRFLQGAWWQALVQLPVEAQRFDLIISNPPYIDAEDACLTQSGLQFEPWQALVADEQGLADFKQICAGAGDYLVDGGWLVLEHGATQASAVAELLHGWQQISSEQDLAGHARVTQAQK